MPYSNTNTQLKNENQNPPELSSPPAVLLHYRRPLIILAHIIAFAASLMLSFLLANNMQFRPPNNPDWLVRQYPLLLLFFIIIKLVVFGLFKQYRGWWRYVGISDLIGIIGASVLSTLIIVVLWFTIVLGVGPVRRLLQNIDEMAQSIFLLDMAGTFLLLAGLRMVTRLYYEEFRTVEAGRLRRLLIVGAGNTGEAYLREIHRKTVAQHEVIGYNYQTVTSC